MRVYVGGIIGKTPYVVGTDFEEVVSMICESCLLPQPSVVWTCEFIDSDTSDTTADLRWLAEIDHRPRFTLYVEAYEVEGSP